MYVCAYFQVLFERRLNALGVRGGEVDRFASQQNRIVQVEVLVIVRSSQHFHQQLCLRSLFWQISNRTKSSLMMMTANLLSELDLRQV